MREDQALDAAHATALMLQTRWVLSTVRQGVVGEGDQATYGYFSFPWDAWMKAMGAIQSTGFWPLAREQPRFLDVGCAIGEKMSLARNLGWDVAGIEKEPEYAKAARELVPGAEVWEGDARDFPDYGLFDCIYSYRCYVDAMVQKAFQADVVRDAKLGAFLFLPSCPPLLRCELVATDVWRKL